MRVIVDITDLRGNPIATRAGRYSSQRDTITFHYAGQVVKLPTHAAIWRFGAYQIAEQRITAQQEKAS